MPVSPGSDNLSVEPMTPKPRSFVFACGALLLAAVAPAQFVPPGGMPAPLPGLPMTDPPVDHPALGAQPLMKDGPARSGGGGGGAKGQPAGPSAGPPPVTVGPQREGKELKRAVAKVNALKWYENLGDAKARSAATSKPILLVQALGDLEGFA